MKTTKSIAQSTTVKLSQLAKSQGKPFDKLLTIFLLERASGSISWQVYPVETILAEKIHALVSKGSANSRAKDVFDIGLLLPKASPVTLQNAIQATFSYRGDSPPADIGSFLTSIDLTLLKKGWKSATSHVKEGADFDSTYEKIIEILTNWGI